MERRDNLESKRSPRHCSRSMASNRALKFPLPKLCAAPLDDLEEEGRPVLDRLGEDLEQIALIIAIHQDTQLGQFADLLDRADPLGQNLVTADGTLRNETSLAVMARTLAMMSPVASAMCCTPGPP